MRAIVLGAIVALLVSLSYSATPLWGSVAGDAAQTFSTRAFLYNPNTTQPATHFNAGAWDLKLETQSSSSYPVICSNNKVYITSFNGSEESRLTQIESDGTTFTLLLNTTASYEYGHMAFSPSGSSLFLLYAPSPQATPSSITIQRFTPNNNQPVLDFTTTFNFANSFEVKDFLPLTDQLLIFRLEQGGISYWFFYKLYSTSAQNIQKSDLSSFGAASCNTDSAESCSFYLTEVNFGYIILNRYSVINDNFTHVWARNITENTVLTSSGQINLYLDSEHIFVNVLFANPNNSSQEIYKFTQDGELTSHVITRSATKDGATTRGYALDVMRKNIILMYADRLDMIDSESLETVRSVTLDRGYSATAVDGSGNVYLASNQSMEVRDVNGTLVWSTNFEQSFEGGKGVRLAVGEDLCVVSGAGNQVLAVFPAVESHGDGDGRLAKWKLALIILGGIGVGLIVLVVIGSVVFLTMRGRRDYEHIK
eukprot:TRINITY_DN21725_c0_g1_i1.p1 TRINITY_DN21725_c0_g1~~TRINITY_DN21725_c0_g1_i1.p1  ORF type:complete len:481 (+),score=106.26 TRINITY_DN21725_c0_g1_i1:77-1519(+)